MTAKISLHCIVDNATEAQLNRAVLYLRRVQPEAVNIAAGSQLDRGMAFVERVRAEVPGIKVFWRHLEDTGIWTKLDPEKWYDSRIAPRLEWAFKNRLIVVTDNESSGDDETMKRYVQWQIKVMGKLHQVGLNAAVGRFATGNIKETQYTLLKPMFDEMTLGDYFSPNEYHNVPSDSSGGHLNRYKLAWQAAGRNLPTAIGEFGMSVHYDPGKGFRSINMSGAYAAQLGIGHFEAWHKPNDVTVFYFTIGGYSWGSFQLVLPDGSDDSLLSVLEAYAAKEPIEVATKPIPMPKPTDARNARKVIVHFAAPLRNIRDGSSTRYKVVGSIHTGDELTIYDPILTDENRGRWEWVETDAGNGFINIDDVSFEPVKLPVTERPTTESPVVPPAPPAPEMPRLYVYRTLLQLLPSEAEKLKAQGFMLEAIA